MLTWLLNRILFRSYRAKKLSEKLLKIMDSEGTEEFLELLLNGMSIFALCNPLFRKISIYF